MVVCNEPAFQVLNIFRSMSAVRAMLISYIKLDDNKTTVKRRLDDYL
jgi:hypothetical protein